MKNILRYILAIPIGVIASMILPKIFMLIFNLFIPFESITNFIEQYLLAFFAGWVAVGFTILIAPRRRILFGIIQIILNLLSIIYMYTVNGDFNYMFLIGGIISLLMMYNLPVSVDDS